MCHLTSLYSCVIVYIIFLEARQQFVKGEKQYVRMDLQDQRRGQRRRLGLAGTDPAVIRRHPDDLPDQIFPDQPHRPLDEDDHRRNF